MKKVMVFDNGKFKAAKSTDTLEGIKPFSAVFRDASSNDTVLQTGSENHCNTQLGSFALKLHQSPNFGDTVTIIDSAGYFNTNPLTIKPNGNKLNNTYQDFTISESDTIYDFIYSNGSYGWKVVKRKLDYPLNALPKVQNDVDLSTLSPTNGDLATTLFDYQLNSYQTDQWVKSTLNQRIQQRNYNNEYLNATFNLPTESYYTLILNGTTTGNLYIRVGTSSIDSGNNYNIAVHGGGRTHTSTRYNSYNYFPLSTISGINFHEILINSTHYSYPKHLLSFGTMQNGTNIYTTQRSCIWNNTINRIQNIQLYHSATNLRFTGTVELWRH